MMPPKAIRGLKYFEHMGAPVPRENADTVVVCYCFPTYSTHELKTTDLRRNFSNFSRQQTDTKLSLPANSKQMTDNKRVSGANVWMGSRRGASTLSGPIELLVVDKSKSTNFHVPTPPHPSTLKPTDLIKPVRVVRLKQEDYETSSLLRDIIRPLENLGVAADATVPGVNVWKGWARVPKKGKSWETRKERLEGVQALNGDFCRVNITYVSLS